MVYGGKGGRLNGRGLLSIRQFLFYKCFKGVRYTKRNNRDRKRHGLGIKRGRKW